MIGFVLSLQLDALASERKLDKVYSAAANPCPVLGQSLARYHPDDLIHINR